MKTNESMSGKQHPRFSWAVSIINPANGDRILEVGCGTGILVHLMATKLSDGKIVGVDKSDSMIRAAEKRNKDYIIKGLVQLSKQEYNTASFDSQQFDKLVAFNVSAFWESPSTYLPAVKTNLKPAGMFYLFYQPPFDKTRTLALKAEEALKAFNYIIMDVLIKDMVPAPVFCIISTPPV